MKNGAISLLDLHFDRLFSGMKELHLQLPVTCNRETLLNEIRELAETNQFSENGRIRLVVFRGDAPGDIAQYIIQAFEFPAQYNQLNQHGLEIGIFPNGRKAIDEFSCLKSNNYLVYAMAARFAGEQAWDDSLVLNQYDRIADSSISNIFIIKNDVIYTPPLSEGCVAGVMRRWLLMNLPSLGWTVVEKPLNKESLEDADEVFLSNALSGIRWVRQMGSVTFPNSHVVSIYTSLSAAIF